LLQCGLDSIFIRVSQLSAIFFMQLGGLHPFDYIPDVAVTIAVTRRIVKSLKCVCGPLTRNMLSPYATE
jgi:hypothetical protein